jgi:hypothetical protein
MVVHNIRRPFRVDGRLVPTSPENLVGQKLEVGYWTVHGQEQRLADNIHVIRGFNLEVRELVLSSLASGHMVTGPEERQNGVLAIDIGAGTTDFVLYRDGAPHTTGVVAVGGGHFTNDLSIGLRLTEGQAEKLKLRFGRAVVQARDKGEKVWLDGNFAIGDRQFPRHAIEQHHGGPRLGAPRGREEEARQLVFPRDLRRGRRPDRGHAKLPGDRRVRGQGLRHVRPPRARRRPGSPRTFAIPATTRRSASSTTGSARPAERAGDEPPPQGRLPAQFVTRLFANA